jgi:hypothetical protein
LWEVVIVVRWNAEAASPPLRRQVAASPPLRRQVAAALFADANVELVAFALRAFALQASVPVAD